MEPFLGQVIMFGGNFAPRGWALCEGQLLPIAQNTALFSLLGTTYGGDGRTTFGLPDLRGRSPISPGRGPGLPTYRQGERGGQATHVLNTLEMPSHNHAAQGTISGNVVVGVNGDTSDASNPAGGVTLGATSGNVVYNEEDATNALNGVSHSLTAAVTVNNNGGSQGHNNMQPYLAVYYIIALQGTFPSRN